MATREIYVVLTSDGDLGDEPWETWQIAQDMAGFTRYPENSKFV